MSTTHLEARHPPSAARGPNAGPPRIASSPCLQLVLRTKVPLRGFRLVVAQKLRTRFWLGFALVVLRAGDPGRRFLGAFQVHSTFRSTGHCGVCCALSQSVAHRTNVRGTATKNNPGFKNPSATRPQCATQKMPFLWHAKSFLGFWRSTPTPPFSSKRTFGQVDCIRERLQKQQLRRRRRGWVLGRLMVRWLQRWFDVSGRLMN